MRQSLLTEEIKLLQRLELGDPNALRSIYECGKRLFDFGMVVRARRGSLKLTDVGLGALLRFQCVTALRAASNGETVELTPDAAQWLKSNRFISPDGSISNRGKLWLQSFEAER